MLRYWLGYEGTDHAAAPVFLTNLQLAD